MRNSDLETTNASSHSLQRAPAFPKLTHLDLGSESPRSDSPQYKLGLTSILKSGLPFLAVLVLDERDPNLLNHRLLYPMRLTGLESLEEDQLYSFKQELSPLSARHLSTLSMQSTAMAEADYLNFFKCRFERLT